MYEAEFRANPNDLDLVKNLYSRLSRSNCKSDALYNEVYLKLHKLEPTSQRGQNNCSKRMQIKAITAQLKNMCRKPSILNRMAQKQASLYMLMAQLERRKGDALSTSTATQARKYAKKSCRIKTRLGKNPTCLSATYTHQVVKLCGPGTGWGQSSSSMGSNRYVGEKHGILTPDFNNEAGQSINRYRQYYPKTSDGFMRGYKKWRIL
jgi:hypothetical protein